MEFTGHSALVDREDVKVIESIPYKHYVRTYTNAIVEGTMVNQKLGAKLQITIQMILCIFDCERKVRCILFKRKKNNNVYI